MTRLWPYSLVEFLRTRKWGQLELEDKVKVMEKWIQDNPGHSDVERVRDGLRLLRTEK